MVTSMYDFYYSENVLDTETTEILQQYLPDDPEALEQDASASEVVTDDVTDSSDVNNASVQDVYEQLLVTNKLLANLYALQVFFLALFIFGFFYKLIKNIVTNKFV